MSDKLKKTLAFSAQPSALTSQSLGSLRDIMGKDKGLNGDLDRLPMLTWIMFLTGSQFKRADCLKRYANKTS